MIKLYGFGPAWDFPDCSPFVSKVDCYLRMVGLPYTAASWRGFQDLQHAPKGKLPYIEDHGKTIADSGVILEYLQAAYGHKLADPVLSPWERAIAHGMRRMMEENLHFVQVYLQWESTAAWQAYLPELFRPLPQAERQTAERQAHEFVRGLLHAQGMGRHARAEVAAIGNADVSALSVYLEEKPYFLGEQPTALDATAYAFLSRSLWVPYESPLKTHMETLTNLVAYCHRMWERYYADKAQK